VALGRYQCTRETCYLHLLGFDSQQKSNVSQKETVSKMSNFWATHPPLGHVTIRTQLNSSIILFPLLCVLFLILLSDTEISYHALQLCMSSCVQRTDTVYLTRRRYDTNCWETFTKLVKSSCDCMWPETKYAPTG
jgi:hypothetical protein